MLGVLGGSGAFGLDRRMDWVDLAVMVGVSVLLWLIVRKQGNLGRREGVLFLSVFVLYLNWLFKSI